MSEHPSPNSQWKYVSFNRNCGATTGENLQISILPAETVLPNTAGNTFIADDDHGAEKFVAYADWVSPKELKITYSAKTRIFKKESQVGPIAITYVMQ